MDPSPTTFPILSYVMNRIPSEAKITTDFVQIDLEQPSPSSSSGLVNKMPHLAHPQVLASMTRAISEVAQTRSVLKILGDRPDHEAVDTAKAKLVEIEASLSKQLEEIVLSPRPVEMDRLEFRAHLTEKEKECRKAAEKEKAVHKAVIGLDELHEAYEKLLKGAEQQLVKIYESAEAAGEEVRMGDNLTVNEEVNEEVVEILQKADGKELERVDLSGRRLRYLPETFGKIQGLIVLNLSKNQLETIPDSIAGLGHLEELNASSNLLESLPDSVGLLQNLKILNVSGNKLVALPDSICQCRSLVELDVSFNNLTYLPTNIGRELGKLQKLFIQLNKIRSFPTSIGEMSSLRHLDAHFNELRGLPHAIGKLEKLEIINLSSNFSDLRELPETFGDLTNLKELDLSNNQIMALPDTFGRLDNLVKLNLEQNPLEVPPMEVVTQGVEAVKLFMAKRWLTLLVEEEQKSIEEKEEQQTGWLTRSTSWLNRYVTESVTGYMGSGGRSPRESYLDQQL